MTERMRIEEVAATLGITLLPWQVKVGQRALDAAGAPSISRATETCCSSSPTRLRAERNRTMAEQEHDLFGAPVGQTTTHIEYGNRMIRDNSFGKKGSVERSNGSNDYDGAWYTGGPKMFEPVQRTVTTIIGPWVATESGEHRDTPANT